ncbi:MAG TPA: TetR/AcrR family transcriptional regulator [Solirubrobacteraceae bacterium]|nr:TetR/AcrR family transcriptional regulator [Solirubrobacteraceae bacterium]
MHGPNVSRSHPREALAERNVDAILGAAEQLLARGVTPTMSAVAAQAGVSRPTVYAHFPDRTRLVEGVVERAVCRAMTAVATAEPDRGPAIDALHRLITASWEQLSQHERIGEAAQRELSSEAMHRSHHAAIAALQRLVDRGRYEGDFRTDIPAPLLVSGALALIHAIADSIRTGVIAPEAASRTVDKLVTELWCGETRGKIG